MTDRDTPSAIADSRTQAIFEKALAAAEKHKGGTVRQMMDGLLGVIHADVSQLERELAVEKRSSGIMIDALEKEISELKVKRLLEVMECDDLDEAILQAEFDAEESLAAARFIKTAANLPENHWPSAHERHLYLALEAALRSRAEKAERELAEALARIEGLEGEIITTGRMLAERSTQLECEAVAGRILLKYIDRLTDPVPEDSLEKIVKEMERDFVSAIEEQKK